MKNLLVATFSFLLILGLSSCGDSGCGQGDWVGTYKLVSGAGECELDESTSIEFEDTFIIEAGSTNSTIGLDGDEITFSDCTATAFFLTLSLDGDELTTTAGPCVATYKKN